MLLISDHNTYWFNVKQIIPSNSLISYASLTSYEQINSEQQESNIEVGECGHVKGCFFWPMWSQTLDDCEMFISYKFFNGLYMRIEMSTRFDFLILAPTISHSNGYLQVRLFNDESNAFSGSLKVLSSFRL